MNIQNLIIYNSISLYEILEEISFNLNFKVYLVKDENSLKDKIKEFKNYLIISNKKISNNYNQLILGNTTFNIFKLVEKINIEMLKIQSNNQSEIKINKYIINLNSREILLNKIGLKLTEKEINIIIFLSKSIKPVTIDELEKNVWSYQSDIETHTVETHIYRLRKKIFNTFSDDKFIISKSNGYQIN